MLNMSVMLSLMQTQNPWCTATTPDTKYTSLKLRKYLFGRWILDYTIPIQRVQLDMARRSGQWTKSWGLKNKERWLSPLHLELVALILSIENMINHTTCQYFGTDCKELVNFDHQRSESLARLFNETLRVNIHSRTLLGLEDHSRSNGTQ